jgi:ArsR family transcriptional regulator, arsenate/arsenite/antimonite-responsive transcriptional repressor
VTVPDEENADSTSRSRELVFRALKGVTRRRILAVLGEHGELTAGTLGERVDGVGRTTVSSHLQVLLTAGLVRERRDGRLRLYSLNRAAVREPFGFLRSLVEHG